MPVTRAPFSVKTKLDALRTEFADLAYALERQGRRDAADVVMQLDTRVREMAEAIAAEDAGDETVRGQPAGIAEFHHDNLP